MLLPTQDSSYGGGTIPPSAHGKQDSDPQKELCVETLHCSSIRLPTATWRNLNLPGNKNNWHSREVDGKTWQKGGWDGRITETENANRIHQAACTWTSMAKLLCVWKLGGLENGEKCVKKKNSSLQMVLEWALILQRIKSEEIILLTRFHESNAWINNWMDFRRHLMPFFYIHFFPYVYPDGFVVTWQTGDENVSVMRRKGGGRIQWR